jgi:glycolate oxidase
MEKSELMAVQFSPDSLDMIARLKAMFDPECRLNPGKLLPTGRGCLEIRQPALTATSTVF